MAGGNALFQVKGIEELRLVIPLTPHHQRISLANHEENGIILIAATQLSFSTASTRSSPSQTGTCRTSSK
jgi:hypothetical protein